MSESEFKCFVEVDVKANSKLEAIHKVENALYSSSSLFNIKRIVSCTKWLDVAYTEIKYD